MATTHKPVSQGQVLAELAKLGDTMNPEVHFTLRLLTYQFYRHHPGTSEWADKELAEIYHDYNPDDGDDEETPSIGEVVEASLSVAEVEAAREAQENEGAPPHQDNSPADFSACIHHATANDSPRYRKPIALACV